MNTHKTKISKSRLLALLSLGALQTEEMMKAVLISINPKIKKLYKK